MRRGWLSLFLFTLTGLARDRIALIEFYGSQGIDTEAVRRALPFHEGDAYSAQTRQQARNAVKKTTGRDATEIARVCCESDGDVVLFIGLAGASSKNFVYQPEPKGVIRLAKEMLALQDRLDAASQAATLKGGDAALEDDSQGYALSHDPVSRSLELALRQYALRHEDELLRVLEASGDARHRQIAAGALGYARQSPRQIAALVRACRDANGDVRNDATRALGVLLESNPALAGQMPPDTFIELMSSGIWTDRNKASSVLEPMSRSRDPQLFARLREQAWDPLIEMARWRTGHAIAAKLILARMAGIPEDGVNIAAAGPLQPLLDRIPSR